MHDVDGWQRTASLLLNLKTLWNCARALFHLLFLGTCTCSDISSACFQNHVPSPRKFGGVTLAILAAFVSKLEGAFHFLKNSRVSSRPLSRTVLLSSSFRLNEWERYSH